MFMDIEHQTQLRVLRALLYQQKAPFSKLNTAGIPNDLFNFHLKHLIMKGFVEKIGMEYKLTERGLEEAGRLDTKSSKLIKQPKVGVLIYVTRKVGNNLEVLLGKRLRDPNLGKNGLFARKIRFGQALIEGAKECLFNETGLTGEFEFAGQLRIIYKHDGEMTSDVIFSCFKTTKISGDLLEKTIDSENFWVSYEKAKNFPNRLPDLEKSLNLFKTGKLFFDELVFDPSNDSPLT